MSTANPIRHNGPTKLPMVTCAILLIHDHFYGYPVPVSTLLWEANSIRCYAEDCIALPACNVYTGTCASEQL